MKILFTDEYSFNVFCANPNKYDEYFHKNFIQNLFDSPLPSYFDPNETLHLSSYWLKKTWYYDFIIPLLSNKEIKTREVIVSLTHQLKVNTKQEFLNILKNIKFYLKDFFYLNFHKFDYTEEEKQEIIQLFSFDEQLLHPKFFDYTQKRDIFDYFGVIPALLFPNCYNLENPEFRLFLRHFKELTLEEQSEIIVNKYSKLNLKEPSYFFIEFVEKFPNEHMNIIHFISENVTTLSEQKFLLEAKPIVESIYLKHNINDF